MTDNIGQIANNMNTLQDAVARIGQRYMGVMVHTLTGILAEVPPATEANRPGRIREVYGKSDAQGRRRVYLRPQGYYERNRGWWYPVMRRKTLPEGKLGKSIGAIKAPKRIRRSYGVVGYKLAAGGTSEHLSRSWVGQVTVSGNEIVGTIGNNATYMPRVQGSQQSPLFARIGWGTVDRAVKTLPIGDIVQDMVDEIAAHIVKGVK